MSKKLNRNGIPILTGRDALTSNMFETQEWGYTVEDILQDAFIDLGINPNRPSVVDSSPLAARGSQGTVSINTRRNVPAIPTFKGVRYLGKLTIPQRIRIAWDTAKFAVTRTGVYAK
jgi:hypothetical protein